MAVALPGLPPVAGVAEVAVVAVQRQPVALAAAILSIQLPARRAQAVPLAQLVRPQPPGSAPQRVVA